MAVNNLATQFPALREWTSTCDAIARGGQNLLIRKGGISEPGFEIESRKFALLPTLFHEKGSGAGEAIKTVTVRVVCELLASVEVPSSANLDPLEKFHRYEAQQLDTRLRYKPEKPLTLMAIRAFALTPDASFGMDVVRPVCRSWHELPLDLSGREVTLIRGPDEEELLSLLKETESRYA